MDVLSNEVFIFILSYLSHKSINQCSLVCKGWYAVTRNPLFFKTIRIYNKKQLDGFIKMATTKKINNRLIGHFVKNILLHDYIDGLNEGMNIQDVKRLCEATPNVTFIDTINLPNGTIIDSNNDSFWTSLSILPQWVQNYYPHWYQLLYNAKNKCTSLEFTLHKNNIIEKDHLGNISNTSGEIEDDDDDDDDDDDEKIIIFQKDERLQKRRLCDSPVPKAFLLAIMFNEYSNICEIIDNEKFLVYHPKVMSFTPMINSSFQYLKHLTINFEKYSQFLINRPQNALELDERIIESIHRSCPVLESLTIKHIYLNISSEQFVYNLLVDPSKVIACHSLKKLSLIQCKILKVSIFDYLSKKYPSLTSLTLQLSWISRPDVTGEYCSSFKTSLHNMLENYIHLSSLSINLSYGDMLNKFGLEIPFWDHQRFLEWIQQHSVPLKSFSISSDIYTNSNSNNKDDNIIDPYQYKEKSKYTYLDHLINLDLHCYDSLLFTHAHFSQLIDKHSISFASLTSLSFSKINSGFRTITNRKNFLLSSNGRFYIYLWLNLFPNLKRLKLINFLITYDPQDMNIMTYPLKELSIEGCHMFLSSHGDGLTRLGQACPSLTVLKLNNTSIELNSVANTPANHDIVMDVSQLALDELFLKKIYGKFDHNVTYVDKLKMTETSSNCVSLMKSSITNQITNTTQNTLQNTSQFIINCKYVDLVNFA